MKKILIVDDDLTLPLQYMAAIKKKRPDAQVTMVDNLEEAKTILASKKFDAVITDNDFFAKPGDALPELNKGIELVAHIRQKNPKTPVLWNSARFENNALSDLYAAAGSPERILGVDKDTHQLTIDSKTFAMRKTGTTRVDFEAIINDFLDGKLGKHTALAASRTGAKGVER